MAKLGDGGWSRAAVRRDQRRFSLKGNRRHVMKSRASQAASAPLARLGRDLTRRADYLGLSD